MKNEDKEMAETVVRIIMSEAIKGVEIFLSRIPDVDLERALDLFEPHACGKKVEESDLRVILEPFLQWVFNTVTRETKDPVLKDVVRAYFGHIQNCEFLKKELLISSTRFVN